jgi:hypothetical protein
MRSSVRALYRRRARRPRVRDPPDPQGCRWLAGVRSTFVQLDGGDELDDGNIQPDTGELIEQPANAIGLGHMARSRPQE